MQLKQILENMDKMPSTLKGFNDTPKLTAEQKRKLMEMVSRYNEFGQKLKMENSLIETATALAEIAELAETYACNEGQDWFATEVVKSDFKRARGVSESFQKIARECYGKVQQLNALYEDFGQVLSRYYEISDPVQEVLPNPADLKSQKGLPNANPNIVAPEASTIMQEVKPNPKNLKSQHCLPAGGPAKAQVKEVTHNDKNIKSQRCLPAGGPAPAQVKEAKSNTIDPRKVLSTMIRLYDSGREEQLEKIFYQFIRSKGIDVDSDEFDELTQGGGMLSSEEMMKVVDSMIPQQPVQEVSCNDKNIKSQRCLPAGGPAKAQVKEVSPPGFDEKRPDIVKNLSKQYGKDDPKKYATMWKIHKKVDEVNYNEANLQSQRELPQASSANNCGCLPKPENPSPDVNPAGAGEMNVKGERDVPQGGPAPKQIKEVDYNVNDLQSQRKLPSLGDILKMK